MEYAVIDAGAVIGGAVALVIAIVGGALTMAWKLGGLANKVEELASDVRDLRAQRKTGW